ncbi:MAG: TRAP transporter substrate-binding protein DctP, partial [Cetobacterium sp.]
MKKIISFLVLALTILTGCGKSEGGSSKKLKLAHALTESHPVHLAMVEFGKEVSEKTNGDIEVLIFPNGQLGGEREITELMQAGAIDIIKTNAGPLESFAQEYSILSLPYLFRDMDHHLRVVKSEIGEEILAATIDRGFIGLTFYNSGTRNFYT